MRVLVDTSVWVEHFRLGVPALVGLLGQDAVLMHPYVLAELACGTPPKPRARTLADLGRLMPAPVATQIELLALIERNALHGKGCGMVDIALLASARLDPAARLWTLDKRLNTLAVRLGIAWAPAAT
jgi:predicted nucleic acid-binding protein